MSQSEFARRGKHVSVSQVSYFLKGERGAGEALYKATAEALNMPLDEVLRLAGVLPEGGTGQAQPSPETQYLLERLEALGEEERDLVLDFIEMLEMRRERE